MPNNGIHRGQMTKLLLKMPTWMPFMMNLLVRCFTKWMDCICHFSFRFFIFVCLSETIILDICGHICLRHFFHNCCTDLNWTWNWLQALIAHIFTHLA
jgi:hypothetical protein